MSSSEHTKVFLTAAETAYCASIKDRDTELRGFLSVQSLADLPDPRTWLLYLTQIKDILGNTSNSIGFLATLLAKDYLARRFSVVGFDAAAKAQGAPGPDIEVRTSDGKLVRCELKTTRPYQPGFGANQKKEILKDLKKLVECSADYKLMLVTDDQSYTTLCGTNYAAFAPSVEIVNLLTEHSYRHVDAR
jgi:hypothetical protein